MLVNREALFWQVIRRLEKTPDVVLDTETTGLESWLGDKLCGIGFSMTDGFTCYLPFRHRINNTDMPMLSMLGMAPPNENLDLGLLPALWKALKTVPKIIGHNVKFDLAIMTQDGYVMPDDQLLEDTMSMARLCYYGTFPDLSLDGITEDLLGKHHAVYKKEFQKYLRDNGWHQNYDYVPADKAGIYCEKDVENTRNVMFELAQKITQTGQDVVRLSEAETIRTVWNMEARGMYYDAAYRDQCVPKVQARIDMLVAAIQHEIGYPFNPASGKELDKGMNHIGLVSTNIGKSGQGKWDVAELMKLEHPIGGMIIELRGLMKVKSTYLDSLYKWDKCGVIHCHFKPYGTATGRMSGENPNLQNLTRGVQNLMGSEMSEEVLNAFKAMLGAYQGQTIDTSKSGTGGAVSSLTTGTVKGLTEKFDDTDDMTIAVRRLYIARPGFRLWFIDYEQMEMRVFADYVQDEELSRLLESSGFDFHSFAATSVWGVTEESELWKFYRTLAKAVNFGLIFGIGDEKLAAQIQKTKEEATIYKFEYFNRFPKSFDFIKSVHRAVETRGWIKNRFGRRYELEPDKGYVGVNYLVQGTSADIVKNRMVACDKYLVKEKVKSRLISQVHDELIFELADDEQYQLIPILQEIIEERLIQTFLPADVSIGVPSMAQKKKVCIDCFTIDPAKDGHFCEKKNKRKFNL